MTLQALFFLFFTVIIGIVLIYIGYIFINSLIARKYEIEPEKNLAYTILCSAMLFSIGTLLADTISPIRTAIQLSQGQGISVAESVTKYAIFFILVGFTLGMTINIIAIKLFNFFTRDINEMEEIKNNNIAVAILTATLIIVILGFSREGYVAVLETLLPYPTVPNFK